MYINNKSYKISIHCIVDYNHIAITSYKESLLKTCVCMRNIIDK